MSVIHFLLVYDARARRLISSQDFADADVASAAYARAEREHIDEPDIEIVLVGADSIETIRKTHGHYFAAGGPELQLPELASR